MESREWLGNQYRQDSAERSYDWYFVNGTSYDAPKTFSEGEDIIDDLVARGIFGEFDAEIEYFRMRNGARFGVPYTECDGFNAENAWGGCMKCGLKLEEHRPNA